MNSLFEKLIARTWNRLATPAPKRTSGESLDLGAQIVDERIVARRVTIPQAKRPEHLAILGKTGRGKSFFLRHLAGQDIRADRGFLSMDLHGDTTPFLLKLIAQEEVRRRADLSTKLIIIEPADPEFSIGLNVLERRPGEQMFVQLAEFAEILKSRWHLDHLGARTEELLRNSLHLLADNNLTLMELTMLLTNETFRTVCLRQASNPDIAEYFRSRFDQQSEAMQAVYRDAILNKVSSFTADPRFRHILGQRSSSFSLVQAIDDGYWIILDLNKGRLGEQAATLGSLLLTKLKNALFARRRRGLFTLYCDEIQNLVAYEGSGLDTLLSEARKFGASIVSANQYMDQYPPAMRAAILSVGTHVFFQLSSADADKIGAALDGGKKLAELLKNLPKRHMVVKSGHERFREAVVPTVAEPRVDYADLYNRCRARWARRRTDIEAEIRARRQQAGQRTEEVLNGWE
jgi:hypothetical protein